MTQTEKRLVLESFQSIREDLSPLSLLFYGRLFELDPALRPMFHGDIARQGLKLMEMLSAVVANLDTIDTLTPVLHAMGQRHAGYGVVPSHYRIVEEALLWALAQGLGMDSGSEVLAAWRKVIGKVSAAMQTGAEHLSPASSGVAAPL